MSYSIYKAVDATSNGLEVSSNRLCLIADEKISRYQNIEVSTGETIILAVSEDRWYKPLDSISYTLGQGLQALASMTTKQEDPLDEIRKSMVTNNRVCNCGSNDHWAECQVGSIYCG